MDPRMLHVFARVLLASVFVVVGGHRLLIGFGVLAGGTVTNGSLVFSAIEVVLGLLILVGWKVRPLAWLSAAVLAVDAGLSHPFWALGGAAADAQLLHFMKNVGLVGGFLLLAAHEGGSRRR